MPKRSGRSAVGELLARIEQRRQLLAAEGLFDPARKRPLPFLPQRIGLITGRDSAAERDVIDNATRRWPGVDFRVENTAVQGHDAARQVIEAIAQLDKADDVDVIVIARGGGALEDLLPFSDEGLIRAVAACTTPVVSAIGHEEDQPLLDLVADLRASTPTDAAKRVVPDVREEFDRLGDVRDRARYVIEQLIAREQHGLDSMRARPVMARPHEIFERHEEALPSSSPARAATSTTNSPAPTTISSTDWPGCVRCRRLPRSSAGMPSCSQPRVRSSPTPRGRARRHT